MGRGGRLDFTKIEWVLYGGGLEVCQEKCGICIVIAGDYYMLTLDDIKKAASIICPKYGVENAYLFGSYARNEADENSDVDIRIDTSKDNPKLKSMLKVCSMQCDLEDLLHKDVQLVTTRPNLTSETNSLFWKNVMRDEVLIYANK